MPLWSGMSLFANSETLFPRHCPLALCISSIRVSSSSRLSGEVWSSEAFEGHHFSSGCLLWLWGFELMWGILGRMEAVKVQVRAWAFGRGRKCDERVLRRVFEVVKSCVI